MNSIELRAVQLYQSRKTSFYALVLLVFVILESSLIAIQEKDTATASEEKRKELKTIIVDSYYPYTYVNKDGSPDGFSIDLAKAVAQVMGMSLNVQVDTWEHAKAALENEKIDFLPMMAFSKERDKIFDFSVPHTIAYDAFFTRNDSVKINSVNDLAGKKVIVMKNDQAYDYLISTHKFEPESLILVDGLPQALRLLAAGQGDAALMPKLVGLIMSKDLNLTNITRSPSVIEEYNRPFSFAVKKDNQLLLERLGQGLKIVKNIGQYDGIYKKWFGAVEPERISQKEALKYTAGAVSFFLIVGAALFFWFLTLKRQVVQRTKELRESETNLRTLIRTIPDLVWLKDSQGVYLACNSRFERFFGAKEKDIIGKTDYDFVDKELADFFRKHDKMAMAKGEPSKNEEEIVFADDGHREILETIKTPMCRSDGRLAGVLGIGHDITDRKKAEEALQKSERMIKGILDASPIGIMLSVNRNIEWVNNSWIRMFGFTNKKEYTSKPTRILYPSDRDYEEARSRVYATPHYSDIREVEAVMMRHNGALFPASIRISPVDPSDPSKGTISAITDISSRKQAEEEKIKFETQLRQSHKMEAIGTLAGGVAHEFNNILAIIIGNTELAVGDVPESNPARKYLKEILSASLRAKDVVNQILGFAEKSVFHLMPVKISPIISETLILIRASVPRTIEIREDLSCPSDTVMADGSQIKLVLMNLCANAKDAMKAQGGVLEVKLENILIDEKIAGLSPGNYLKLTVRDTGHGIDPNFIDRIFDPYFTTSSLADASGMGLAVVHGIVRHHNGAITVTSEPGKGSVFEVLFPLTGNETRAEDGETRQALDRKK